MSKILDDLANQASYLTRQEKFDLATLLLQMNDGVPEPDASIVWRQEILDRIRAIEEGQVEGFLLDDVIRDAEARSRHED